MMLFGFSTCGDGAPSPVIDMALEAVFEDGRIVQSMFVDIKRGASAIRVLVYREGTTGKWLHSDGISFNGLQRTPENLVRSLGYAGPCEEYYVFPAT